jgi:hypothetical protein
MREFSYEEWDRMENGLSTLVYAIPLATERQESEQNTLPPDTKTPQAGFYHDSRDVG